jgi:Patatin-like phospholipase
MTAAGASDFEKVLTDEISEIQASRERRLPEIKFPHAASPDPYAQAHEAQLFGLAFSGGGIRSATFNLGILQALSELGVLRWVDYLSTVSGGGYIGSWLAAWIKRQNPGTAPTPVEAVEDRLAPDQRARFEAEKLNPIHFLRQYSNYLTPRTGFFGADTWTMISIYVRNVILNQAILLSALAAVLMVPRFAAWPFDAAEDSTGPFAIGAAALLCAILFIGWNLVRLERNGGHRNLPFYARQSGIQVLIAFPILAAAYFSSIAMWQFVSQFSDTLPALAESWPIWIGAAIIFAGLMFIVSLCGIFRRAIKLRKVPAAIGLALLSSVLPGAFGGILLWGLAYLFDLLQFGDAGKWHALVWGPPVLVAVFSLVVVLHLGLVGIAFPDSGREWWSRLGGWLFIYSLGWVGLVTVAIYGPLLLGLGAKSVAGISLGWAATTIGGLFAGRSAATGSRQSGAGVRLVAQAAPYIFVVGLLLAVSLSIQFIVPCLDADGPACGVRHSLFDNWAGLESGPLATLHFDLLSKTPFSVLSVTWLGLAVIAVVLAWRVDINEFSMHHFYRNRLVRCYLGASHERQPQAFTGFDPHDDIPLADLAGNAFTGPYPLINTTLNLVSGEDLGWQQRKGASFVFTPKYCGYQISDRLGVRGDARRSSKHNGTWPGYRCTPDYAYREQGGISLGTAMAISGAAASPNEGYHSSPATAFLMTVFDVRLGWWLGNPATRKYHRSAPRVALYCLVRELFGLTNYRSNFVYLSDGGHFENLGVYELVRRRCRYIIACDADQDGGLGFGDLGNLIRKVRTDMGIDIEIDVDSIRHQEGAGFSKWHCAIGTIRYDALGEGATPGTLVYIKSSLTGDEASDVLSYRAQERAFPHQSTADQWFDESQFESYRKLGYHAGRKTFEAVDEHQPMQNGVENFFVALRQAWYPASSAVAAAFTKHIATLDRLVERLRKEGTLRFLDAQLCPEWKRLNAGVTSPPAVNLWLPTNADELRSGFYFCNSLIQLMESVYLDLKLDQEHDHPDNRGWMNLFKHCSWSGMFRATWAISASSYGARFQTFCRRLLGIETGEVEVLPFTPEKEDQLNFHEVQLLREFLKTNDGKTGPDQIQLLQVVVRDVSNPVATDAGALRFTFGITMVQDGKVVLFRVQDHLRKMGLARGALRKMVHEQGVSWFDKTRLVSYLAAATQPRGDRDLRKEIKNELESRQPQDREPASPEVVRELMEMAHHENLERFEQLFRSVQREPREKQLGAKA